MDAAMQRILDELARMEERLTGALAGRCGEQSVRGSTPSFNDDSGAPLDSDADSSVHGGHGSALSHPAPIREAASRAPAPAALPNPREKIRCRLIDRTKLSRDVRLIRFSLPSPDQALGLPIGTHVFDCASVDGKSCMRAYMPTSKEDEVLNAVPNRCLMFCFNLIQSCVSPTLCWKIPWPPPISLESLHIGDYASFVTEIAATDPPEQLNSLLNVLQARGEKIVSPGANRGLIPVVVPLSDSLTGNLTSLLRWPTRLWLLAKNATYISGNEPGRISREVSKVEKRRTVKSTRCNERSSRCHCVIILDIPSVEGRLMLVDMAGSENIEVAGQTGFEAKMQTTKINQRNTALKRVVESIDNGDSQVPIKDSKLPMLLQDLFEHDKSKILMILCANSDPKELHRTFSTLAKAKSIIRAAHASTPRTKMRYKELSAMLNSRIVAINQFIHKLQKQNELREQELHEARTVLKLKEEELAQLRAKLNLMEGQGKTTENEINSKVMENELMKMEETMHKQQQELTVLRQRLQDFEKLWTFLEINTWKATKIKGLEVLEYVGIERIEFIVEQPDMIDYKNHTVIGFTMCFGGVCSLAKIQWLSIVLEYFGIRCLPRFSAFPQVRPVGSRARFRYPFQCCKSCCYKAQNPYHIHVLNQSNTLPNKSSPATSSASKLATLSAAWGQAAFQGVGNVSHTVSQTTSSEQ